MSWTADGSALTDHVRFVRVLNEGTRTTRGRNIPIPGRYGEHHTLEKYYSGSDVLLEVGLLLEDSHSHLSSLVGIFGNGQTTLQRTDHPAGTVRADVELDDGLRQTQDRFTYLLPLRRADGVWEDSSASQASGTAPSITTGGDSAVGDPVVTFSAPGTAILVGEWGTATAEWAGSGTAIMDSGARRVTKAGADVDENFTIDQKWWFRFAPDTTVDLTATVSITVDWRNKHA